MFSCEYCEMFKDTYFEEQLLEEQRLQRLTLGSHLRVTPWGPTQGSIFGSHLRVRYLLNPLPPPP